MERSSGSLCQSLCGLNRCYASHAASLLRSIVIGDLMCRVWGKVGHHGHSAQACPGGGLNYKTFKKQVLMGGSSHGGRAIVAFARTVYSQRAVDADEFLR